MTASNEKRAVLALLLITSFMAGYVAALQAGPAPMGDVPGIPDVTPTGSATGGLPPYIGKVLVNGTPVGDGVTGSDGYYAYLAKGEYVNVTVDAFEPLSIELEVNTTTDVKIVKTAMTAVGPSRFAHTFVINGSYSVGSTYKVQVKSTNSKGVQTYRFFAKIVSFPAAAFRAQVQIPGKGVSDVDENLPAYVDWDDRGKNIRISATVLDIDNALNTPTVEFWYPTDGVNASATWQKMTLAYVGNVVYSGMAMANYSAATFQVPAKSSWDAKDSPAGIKVIDATTGAARAYNFTLRVLNAMPRITSLTLNTNQVALDAAITIKWNVTDPDDLLPLPQRADEYSRIEVNITRQTGALFYRLADAKAKWNQTDGLWTVIKSMSGAVSDAYTVTVTVYDKNDGTSFEGVTRQRVHFAYNAATYANVPRLSSTSLNQSTAAKDTGVEVTAVITDSDTNLASQQQTLYVYSNRQFTLTPLSIVMTYVGAAGADYTFRANVPVTKWNSSGVYAFYIRASDGTNNIITDGGFSYRRTGRPTGYGNAFGFGGNMGTVALNFTVTAATSSITATTGEDIAYRNSRPYEYKGTAGDTNGASFNYVAFDYRDTAGTWARLATATYAANAYSVSGTVSYSKSVGWYIFRVRGLNRDGDFVVAGTRLIKVWANQPFFSESDFTLPETSYRGALFEATTSVTKKDLSTTEAVFGEFKVTLDKQGSPLVVRDPLSITNKFVGIGYTDVKADFNVHINATEDEYYPTVILYDNSLPWNQSFTYTFTTKYMNVKNALPQVSMPVMNLTTAYRANQSVNIAVNLTDSEDDDSNTRPTVVAVFHEAAKTYENDVARAEMTRVSGNLWNLDYFFGAVFRTGVAIKVTVEVTDSDGGVNRSTSTGTIVLVNTNPYVEVVVSSLKPYRGFAFIANVTPTDSDSALEQLSWTVKLFKVTVLKQSWGEVRQVNWTIPTTSEYIGSGFYLQVKVDDDSGGSYTETIPLEILNAPPQIVNVTIVPTYITRISGSYSFNAIINDPETPAVNLQAKLIVKSFDGKEEQLSLGRDGADASKMMTSVMISNKSLIGPAELIFTVSDQDGGSTSHSQPIVVVNALPVYFGADFFIGAKLKRDAAENVSSVTRGDKMLVRVNASDPESRLNYYVVSFKKDTTTYNFTAGFRGGFSPENVTVYTGEIPDGTYSVWITVYDMDGGVVYNPVAYNIVVSPDFLLDVERQMVTVVAVVIAALVGLLIGALAAKSIITGSRQPIEAIGKPVKAEDVFQRKKGKSTSPKKEKPERVKPEPEEESTAEPEPETGPEETAPDEVTGSGDDVEPDDGTGEDAVPEKKGTPKKDKSPYRRKRSLR